MKEEGMKKCLKIKHNNWKFGKENTFAYRNRLE